MGLCRLTIMLRSYSGMVISQPEPDSTRSYFHVLASRDDEDAPLAPDDDAITGDVIVDIASSDILGHVVKESAAVVPPLSFDVLSGFVSRSDDVLAFPFMDLSIFEYPLVGHAMLSFMDGFSGYNQIMMALEDREKTSFIT